MKLMQNGLDSFKKALTKLFDIENIEHDEIEIALKEVVLSYHHALETLFKHLVSQKNEFLIYDNQEDIFRHRAEKSNRKINVRTITFMDSFYRVIVLYDIPIDGSVYNAIDSLNNVRNSLTHHETDLEIKEVENIISCTLPFILKLFNSCIEDFKSFMQENKIDSNVKDLYARNFSWEFITIVKALGSIYRSEIKINKLKRNGKEFSSQSARIKQLHTHKFSLSVCPLCGEEFFLIEGTVIENASSIGVYGMCKLCGFELSKDLLILEYNSYSKYNKIRETVVGKFESIIFDYGFYYGIHTIDEMKSAVKANSDAFDIFYKEMVSKYFFEIMMLLEEKQQKEINKLEDETDYEFLIRLFDNLTPYERTIFIDKRNILATFLRIYKINMDEKLDDKGNAYDFNGDTISITIDNILCLYENWVENKCEYESIFNKLLKHNDYNDILDEILTDTHGGNIWSDLAGSSNCDFGTIDNVNAYCGDIEYIESVIETEECIEINCVFEIEIETESYFDHEYFPNGSQIIYIDAVILYNKYDDSFELKSKSLLTV